MGRAQVRRQRRRRAVVTIGVPWKNALTAFSPHGLNCSVVSVEWPVSGTTTIVASGIRALTASALAVGVRRSSAPEMISVGTSGSEVIVVSGAAVANGQYAHTGAELSSTAVWR